jgi:hypothetical protein
MSSSTTKILFRLIAGAIGLFSLLGLPGCALTATHAIIDWVDFIKFDGITYLANRSETSQPLQAHDLGRVFATVQFKLEGNVDDPTYQTRDGDAAFLEPGTPVYTVKDYAPHFRLAVKQQEGILLYEADTNPNARHGSDLLDIGDKVQYLGINSGQDGITELGALNDQQQVAALVNMVLHAPVDQTRQDQTGNRYFIAFHLHDGTLVIRSYWTQSRELSRGIMMPEKFGVTVEQALQQ